MFSWVCVFVLSSRFVERANPLRIDMEREYEEGVCPIFFLGGLGFLHLRTHRLDNTVVWSSVYCAPPADVDLFEGEDPMSVQIPNLEQEAPVCHIYFFLVSLGVSLSSRHFVLLP